jgi:hypothetical protein
MTVTEPWRSAAPAAFAAFDRVEAITRGSLDDALLVPVQTAVATLLRQPVEVNDPLLLADAESDPRVATCVRFAEQFVVDVAGIADGDRAELSGALGAAALHVRAGRLCRRCFPTADRAEGLYGRPYPPIPVEPGDLWAALKRSCESSPRVCTDPVTTEPPLRGAPRNHCRLCQSRLSVRAPTRLVIEPVPCDRRLRAQRLDIASRRWRSFH